MGVRFRGVNVTDVYARGVNVNLTPLTSKRGALATDARGCSLWRYLLERPSPTWESRVIDSRGVSATPHCVVTATPPQVCIIFVIINGPSSIIPYIYVTPPPGSAPSRLVSSAERVANPVILLFRLYYGCHTLRHRSDDIFQGISLVFPLKSLL